MTAPPGKGVFLRAGYDQPAFARTIGARWVLVHSPRTSDSTLRALVAAYPGAVYLYDHESQTPGTVFGSANAMMSRAVLIGGVRGVMLDLEGTSWNTDARALQVRSLVETIRGAGLDAAMTTFPYFNARVRHRAAYGSRLSFVALQLYPKGPTGSTAAQRRGWLADWRRAGWPEVIPAYGGWGMGAGEQAAHLAELGPQRSATLWTGTPPSATVTAVARAWDPVRGTVAGVAGPAGGPAGSGPKTGGSALLVALLVVLGVAAAVAAWVTLR